jgi:hypothetical protein
VCPHERGNGDVFRCQYHAGPTRTTATCWRRRSTKLTTRSCARKISG